MEGVVTGLLGSILVVMIGGFSALWYRLGRLEGRMDGLDRQMGELRGGMTGLEGRMTGVESCLNHLEERVAGLEGKVAGVEGHLNRIESVLKER